MTTEQIKKLCGDTMVYLDKARQDDLPMSARANLDAAKDIVTHIYEQPFDVTECSESLCKIISGLIESARYFELSCEMPLYLAYKFANAIYCGVREMRP